MALLPGKGDTGFTLGGFLILAALGTFLWRGAPLESSRPIGDEGNQQTGTILSKKVPARLWQDPFKAVYLHEQNARSSSATTPYYGESAEGVLAPLDGDKTVTELTLLMVQLNPGAYAELEERRRRRRYAVLSGLSDEHFVPRNPEILNVFYQPNTDSGYYHCFAGDEAVTSRSVHEKCFPIPYEWYGYENPVTGSPGGRRVLVMWLDESQFVNMPFTGLRRLLEGLTSASHLKDIKVTATLLGPERSDALRNLVKSKETDAHKWLICQSGYSEFNIVSSTATVDDDDLLRVKNKPPLIALRDQLGEISCKTDETKTRMHFLRSIQSDRALIETLAEELTSRRQIDTKNDRVIVISESDTYFGRSLPRAFIKRFCSRSGSNENACDKQYKNIVKYSYQRGIDGVVAGMKQPAEKPTSNKSQKGSQLSPSMDATMVRRPVGTGQFDYLRRLATDIKSKHREWTLETGHGVRAVVLLGSDVYDKLLILRALRPELPGALFATTDLDAQLLHPAEYNWTRSLVIASTYEFGLSSLVPAETMPFRDSYQTSIYLATRMAFNRFIWPKRTFTQKDMNGKTPPQLMEIGRQQLVQLPIEREGNSFWNIKQRQSFFWPISLGLLVIAGLGLFAVHQIRPKSGRVILVLLVLVTLFFGLGVRIYTQTNIGEPVAIFAGASIWPAEYIRVVSVVLALSFIWLVLHRLRENWNDLGYRYFGMKKTSEPEGLTLSEIHNHWRPVLASPLEHLKNVKPGSLAAWVMVGVMIGGMIVVLPTQLPIAKKIWLLMGWWGALGVIWWLLMYGRLWRKFRVLAINKWVTSWRRDEAVKGADDLWRAYGQYGANDQRFIRTIAYLIIYFAFASIIFAILGAPSSPCRGEAACAIDRMTLGFSVLSMLILLFLVADAARLCICWVDSVRNEKVDWSKSNLREFIQRLRLPDTHAEAWMKVYLIGERTNEITRLIYYPVIIILLMLLARSTYFDDWDFPQALAIVVGLNFVIVLGSIIRLNFVAQSVREDILQDLRDEKLAGDREEAESYEPSATERQELIHRLEQLHIGAYMKVWEQPAVRATLLLLGGVAITYAEYLFVVR